MEESPLQLVSEIGTQLAQISRFNKSIFLKSLKQAAIALSEIEQPAASSSSEASDKISALKKLETATNPLRKSIIKHRLLHQNDKDVKLFVAICVAEIFRILAPEPPFEDQYLRGVFELIVSVFKELGDTACPFFSRRVKILHTIARCKCFVIMLDIDCNDLVLEMFSSFFSAVSEHHQPGLINNILSIMTHIVNEEVTQPLLELILLNLIKQKKDAPSTASQLAVSIIQSCSEKLEPFVCGFLTSCFLDRDTAGSKLKEFYHEIMFKIFQCAPQMLLAVIPSLIEELMVDQVDVRIKAVRLTGKLFQLPENCRAERYRDLFTEFLKRFSDKSTEVRVSALQCAKACYLANRYRSESQDVLTTLESRLFDFDDRVRTEAVIVACDIARSNLEFVPLKLISAATERLRDKKISVRKRALQKLLEVYRDYCKKCSEGRMQISNHFEEIPRKILMLCYDKDCKDFRSQNIERVLVEDLFPVLEIEERIRHWVHMFSQLTPSQEKALNSILSQKQRLRTEMHFYLSLRKKEKENCPEETQKRVASSFIKMSASFPDPSKAEECFQRLNKMKDNNIFNALEALLGELTIKNAETARDKFLKSIGDKHPDFEFLQLLSSKCLYMFDSEHVRCILDGLCSNGFGEKDLEDSSIKLLLAIINISPSLLRGLEVKFQKLLEKGDLINDKLIEVLAKAGPHISVKFSDFYPFLERVCLEGTRTQSKYAVSAIASLSFTSEQFIFSKLCKGLVDSLHSGRNVPTVLQSLGCIAQYSVPTFETLDEDITSYIYKNIFQVEQSNAATSYSETSCKLKIYGLKTLVKSFLPHRGTPVKRTINELLGILSKMLQTADTSNGLISRECNKAHIRLGAAKSVLQLSRRWDLHISPEIFCSTILMAKDSSTIVRRSFLDKTHKWLKARLIPIRYACAFALATSDCLKDLQDDSLKYMAEFIKEYSRAARIRQNSGAQGVSVTDYPAYIVVFLMHFLAHDSGFPPEDCQDEEKNALFFSPLYSLLQALVNASIVDGDMDLVNDAVLYLLHIFHAIKRAEDAVDAQRTPNLHILADIGISIVKELNRNGISSSRAPGQILLPSSLYKISLAKKSKEANSESLSPFRFDQSFVVRVVHILKSHIAQPTRTLPKRSQKHPEMSAQSGKVFHVPTSGTMEAKKKIVRRETSRECKRKRASSPTTITVEECRNGVSKSSEGNLEKELLSSCDSVTVEPSSTESQFSVRNMERSTGSLIETVRQVSSITAEPLKCPRSKFKDPCRTKEFSDKHEALVGKRIKLLSPTDRCFYYGTVDGFNSQNNTHKITYDSGEVELLCLDSESWETIADGSSSEMEVLLEEDPNTIHLRHGDNVSDSSLGGLNVDASEDVPTQQPKALSKQERVKSSSRTEQTLPKQERGKSSTRTEQALPEQERWKSSTRTEQALPKQERGKSSTRTEQALPKQERGKSSTRTVPLAEKGKRGQKDSAKTSASQVMNIDDAPVASRTRRRKAQ